ncbi:hypothetical protein ACWN8V_13230 [Vagococcus elongatus]|uniref:Uncharacterized protein n=1 Tax=Vagococcus elongatus TaxID=180344 RepID=A0A430AL98_9ENTE|nr:hypothetical protein [Vagococcus elongatus]RSU08869.1 hypothetical protein CBF29_13000 [Vagococcus elongatus]
MQTKLSKKMLEKAFKKMKERENNQTPLDFQRFKKNRQKKYPRKPGRPEKGYISHKKAYKSYINQWKQY